MIPKYAEGHYTLETFFDALSHRLAGYVKIYNNNVFPFSGKVLGFPGIYVQNRADCFSRIVELASITETEMHVDICETKNTDGSEFIHDTVVLGEKP